MRNQTVMTKKLGIWATALLCCAGLVGALGQMWANAASAPQQAAPAPADRLLIDGLKRFGELERPGVVFRHTKHTAALEEQGLSCQRCHLDGEKGMALQFKRLADTDKTTVMDIYHAECISCHTETADSGKASGPVTCGSCHVEDRIEPATSRWRAIDLDRSLHYRHTERLENKCETCHHAYDEASKTLVYRKGEEGACLYCHKAQTEENRISGRLAAHQACISCHREQTAAGKDSGPADCLSCHDVEAQAGIRVVKDVPRMKRNQPDATFVKVSPVSTDANPHAAPPYQMQRVAFDHQAHEGYNDTCKVCHHAALTDCATCHTSAGSDEGGQVNLATAMHKAGADASCIGCHQQRQAATECAGCHSPAAIAAAQEPANNRDQACLACHRIPLEGTADVASDRAASEALARQWLDARAEVTPVRDLEKIPDKVTIGILSDQFEPAILPHRQIVLALMDGVATSPMAGTFHEDAYTLCQGCHHQSPPAANPPSCVSCHDRDMGAKTDDRPGLLAAYHQQCIGCHDRMEIVKPAAQDCAACHKERQQ